MYTKPLKALRKCFKRDFLKDTSGNVAIIAGLAIIPIIGVAGLALDFQLVVTKKNTVQQTLDATMIAVARERQAGAEADDVNMIANDFFKDLLALNDPGLVCEKVETSSVEDSEQINAKVDCEQPTTLSAIFGREKFDFRVESGSTFGVGEVDVAFVFDLSGSMNVRGRLAALRESADEAFDILLATDVARAESVRIAIASYNHSVNAGEYFDDVVAFNRRLSTFGTSESVGDLYPENIGVVQIDARDNRRFWDYEDIVCTRGSSNSRTSNCTRHSDYAARFYPEESSCVYARQGADAFTDRMPAPERYLLADQPVWDYGDNRVDSNRRNDFNNKSKGQAAIESTAVGTYKSGRESRTNPPSRRARSTTADNTAPLSYATNRFNRNYSPTNNALTYHIRLRENLPGRRPSDFIAGTGGELNACQDSGAPLPLTNRMSDLKAYTRDMRARGGTAGHLGIAWGWYLLSPEWGSIWPSVSEPVPYFEEETAKVMIIMTDGVFNSTHPNTEENSNEMAADYCRAIKDQTNIRIYTIGFDVPTRTENIDGEDVTVPNLPLVEGTEQNILQFCASDESSTFDASGRQELRDAYAQIAAEISDLRIAN